MCKNYYCFHVNFEFTWYGKTIIHTAYISLDQTITMAKKTPKSCISWLQEYKESSLRGRTGLHGLKRPFQHQWFWDSPSPTWSGFACYINLTETCQFTKKKLQEILFTNNPESWVSNNCLLLLLTCLFRMNKFDPFLPSSHLTKDTMQRYATPAREPDKK